MLGVPGSGVAQRDCLADQTSLDRVVVDISEGKRNIPKPVENPRMETIAPEVPCPSSLLVVGPGEIAEKPSHDRR